MKNFYKYFVVQLTLACFAHQGALQCAQEHRIISFNDLDLCSQDQIYDNCDSKTQDALKCTSREMHSELPDRWRQTSGMKDLRLAYYHQNPLIALNNPRCQSLIFPEGLGNYNWSVIDPRSESFYKKHARIRFISEHPDKGDLLKNKYSSFKGSLGEYQHYVSPSGDEQCHFWRNPNPLLIAIAVRDNQSVKEELNGVKYNDFYLTQAKNLAIHQKNVPALRMILHYKNNQLNAHQKHFITKDDYCMVDYLNKRVVSTLNYDLLQNVKNQDDRLFKILVEESDLGVLSRKIPTYNAMDSDDTIQSNLAKMHKEGKCSHTNLDFFKNQLNKKKISHQGIDKQDSRDCTIL